MVYKIILNKLHVILYKGLQILNIMGKKVKETSGQLHFADSEGSDDNVSDNEDNCEMQINSK